MPHAEGSDAPPPPLPRILFIDAYDSFSNNIIALVKDLLQADIESIHIDDERFVGKEDKLFLDYLKGFDAVIAGPGPGSPDVAADVGLIKRLWTLEDDDLLPVLGICLGFQSLAVAYGARVARLNQPRHGIIAEIHHCGKNLFAETDRVFATQYNSLTIRLHCPTTSMWGKGAAPAHWYRDSETPDLVPLAWVLKDADNGPILQAVKHAVRPFWAIQYHPESICTNDGGAKVMSNWWKEALRWRLGKGQSRAARKESPQSQVRATFCTSADDLSQSRSIAIEPTPSSNLVASDDTDAKSLMSVEWTSFALDSKRVADIVEVLRLVSGNVVILESATRENHVPVNAETGRFSILGCLDAGDTGRIEYNSLKKEIRHTRSGDPAATTEDCSDVWAYIKDYMKCRKARNGSPDSPFWGGLVGFVSYEACLQTIDVRPVSEDDDARPDICFVFVQRSIVVDHVSALVYVQSIRPDDESWIDRTCSLLNDSSPTDKVSKVDDTSLGAQHQAMPVQESTNLLQQAKVRMPKREEYCRKVHECQEAIRSGNSYELCLTDQTKLLLPSSTQSTCNNDDWHLYQRLRTHNPAPYGSFLRLQCTNETLSIISSSPERFLGWTRPDTTGGANSTCQFRPIKGTVRKTPSTTRADAEAVLNSSKERAENLMIVDLIRHDLFGVVGSGNVSVEKLMQVEEYETVFQLVSVIEGKLPADEGIVGLDVLAASLPPGSMTGAPKKRSCEILQVIEGGRPRGIYSGVLGYLDVGGGGDFSVVIRTASRWSGDVKVDDDGRSWDVWSIGAGGAVTSQSTDVGEWEEMETKRDALLNALRV